MDHGLFFWFYRRCICQGSGTAFVAFFSLPSHSPVMFRSLLVQGSLDFGPAQRFQQGLACERVFIGAFQMLNTSGPSWLFLPSIMMVYWPWRFHANRDSFNVLSTCSSLEDRFLQWLTLFYLLSPVKNCHWFSCNLRSL